MQLITMEVTRRYIGAEGHRKPGDLVAVDPRRARQLIENGVARFRPGPTETKPAEAAETKAAKKPSDAPKGGRSTRTRSSSASGKAARSSASRAVRVSLPPNVIL